ncbi:hypothetical protein BaRGS_00023780 [Batillaria attramentaria]|uniref:Uncharacterized protein n=1 Tax=Batillaria attramentaria TaxID=370345 RepID=A0ABD0KDK3_9CAEN
MYYSTDRHHMKCPQSQGHKWPSSHHRLMKTQEVFWNRNNKQQAFPTHACAPAGSHSLADSLCTSNQNTRKTTKSRKVKHLQHPFLTSSLKKMCIASTWVLRIISERDGKE